MTFSDEQLERYSRQLLLAGVTFERAERLPTRRVWIDLPSPAAETAAAALLAAGVGVVALARPVPDVVREWLSALNPDARFLDGVADPGACDLQVVAGGAAPHDSARTDGDARIGSARWRLIIEGAGARLIAADSPAPPPCPNVEAGDGFFAPAHGALVAERALRFLLSLDLSAEPPIGVIEAPSSTP